MPPDPGKPLPEDVLKTFSLGLDFEDRLKDLYGATITSSTVGGISVGVGYRNRNCSDGEALKCSNETGIAGSLTPQGSLCAEEYGPTPSKGRDTSPKALSTDEMQQSAIIETVDDPKVIHPNLHFLSSHELCLLGMAPFHSYP